VRVYRGDIQSAVWCLTFAGQYVFAGCDDGSANQFDITNGQHIRTYDGHNGSILSICTLGVDGVKDGFFKKGLICTGSVDGSLRIWRVGGEQMKGALSVGKTAGDGSGNAIHSVTTSSKGVIYTGCAGGTVCEYDLNDTAYTQNGDGTELGLKPTNSWKGSNGAIMGITIMKDYLYTASEDCTAHEFWVAKSGSAAKPIKAAKPERQAPEPKATYVDPSLHNTRRHHSPMRRVEPSRHLAAGGSAAYERSHSAREQQRNEILEKQLQDSLVREASLQAILDRDSTPAPGNLASGRGSEDVDRAEFEEMRAQQKRMEEYNRILEEKLRKLESRK